MDIDHNLLGETETQMLHLTVSEDATTGEPRGISKLPHEMLSEIFQHCTSEPAYVGFKEASTPMVLSQVSSVWRGVAFSNQRLWNNIILDCEDWTNMPQLATAAHDHLRRCGGMEIAIETTGSISENHAGLPIYPIQNLLRPFAHRIRHLTLAFPQDWLNAFLPYHVASNLIPALETVKIVYHRTRDSHGFTTINTFANAPRLRSFSVDCPTEWPNGVREDMFNLPWHQLTDLHLHHFTLPSGELSSMLGQCRNLNACTLFVTKDYHSSTAGPPSTATPIPSLRSLTLCNTKNFNYDKYLERVAFPSLENLNIVVARDSIHNGKWVQAQFNALTFRSCYTLRTFSTSAHINNVDIESVLGDMPSLVELTVLEGEAISDSTLRLLCKGLLGPKLEVLRCAVEPGMLEDFLDMLDCRFVPKKSRAVYRGIRSVVIRCLENAPGYLEARERLQELKESGRDITVRCY